MSERVLVIGGGGFLGRHITRRLVSSGRRVRVFDLRLPSSSPDLEATGLVEYAVGNLANDADLDAALEGVDTVLHLVSTTVPSTSLHSVLVEVEGNVAATARLLDAMVRKGVRRVGYPSSGGTIYGASEVAHREDDELRPTCPYGLGKRLIEDMIRFFGAERGLEYQIWRIANPYGDTSKLHTSQGVVDAFLQRIRAGRPIEIWGAGAAVRDFVFVDDAVRAIGLLLEREVWNETVNVGTGIGTSLADVIATIREAVPKSFSVHHQDAYTGPSHSVLDVSKLRSMTGFSPEFDLRRGIGEAWRRLEDAHGVVER